MKLTSGKLLLQTFRPVEPKDDDENLSFLSSILGGSSTRVFSACSIYFTPE